MMSRPVADLLFRPRSIVVYGASSDPDKLSGRPLAYLLKFGYRGKLYAVNPRREQVQGVRAFADIADVPGPVDLAVIVVPAESVHEAARRCAEAGVGAAIVFASGFAEVGDPGRLAQEELAEIARGSGMRLVGPNCLGSFAAGSRAFATFSTAFDEDGERPDSPIALVTQSGAVGTFSFSMMSRLGVGVRYFANTGNEADVTGVELLTALADSDEVALLLGHLEDGQDTAALEKLVRAADRSSKPLFVLKSGRTVPGASAIGAHTGSVAGDDARFEAVLAGGGGVRLTSMQELADTALIFAAGRPASGARVTILTLSGGAGALATDAAVSAGLVVKPWAAGARKALAEHLPYYASTANPVDVTGSMINDIDILRKSLAVTTASTETDSVLVVMGNADRDADAIVAVLRDGYATTRKPFVVSWTGGSGRPMSALLELGIPTYPDPSRAVAALAQLTRFGARHPAPARQPASSGPSVGAGLKEFVRPHDARLTL